MFVLAAGEEGHIFELFGNWLRAPGNLDALFTSQVDQPSIDALREHLERSAMCIPPPPTGELAIAISLAFMHFLHSALSPASFRAHRGSRWRWAPPMDSAQGIIGIISELIGRDHRQGPVRRAARRDERVTFSEMEGTLILPAGKNVFLSPFARAASGYAVHFFFFFFKGCGRFLNAKIVSAMGVVLGSKTGVYDTVGQNADEESNLDPCDVAELRDMDCRRATSVVAKDLAAGALAGYKKVGKVPPTESQKGSDANGATRSWLPLTCLETAVLKTVTDLGPSHLALAQPHDALYTRGGAAGGIRMTTSTNSLIVAASAQDTRFCEYGGAMNEVCCSACVCADVDVGMCTTHTYNANCIRARVNTM